MGRKTDQSIVLRAGEPLETSAGRRVVLDEKPIRWNAEDVGNWIRHRGWTLKVPPGAHLAWPIYPFNPYRNGPETELVHAVGAISCALTGKQELVLAVETD